MNRNLCVLAALLLFSSVLIAQTNTWNGTTNTDWGTASNWSLNLVPTTDHDVVIPNSNSANANPIINISNAVCKTLTLSAGNRANSVTVNAGATFVVNGDITLQAASGNITKAFIVNGTVLAVNLIMTDPGTDNRVNELSIGAGGSISLTTDLTMPGNALRNKVTFTGAGILRVQGAMTGGGLTASTGTVFFSGSGPQTIPAYSYYNLSCAGANTKTASAALTVANNLDIASGVTMNMATFALSGASLTTSGTGVLRTQNNTATPIPSGRTWSFGVTYDLAGNQTIPVGNYFNLETGGSGIKTLSGNTTVSGTLTFTAGKIDGGTNTLTLTSATPATHISGGSATSYMYNTGAGRLRRNNLAANSGAYTFPVGTANFLMYVQVEPLDPGTSDFAVSVFQGLTQDGTPTGTPFTNLNPVVNATWNIDRPVGTGDAEVLVSWDAALEGSAFATFTGPQIGISHFTLGNWQLAIGSGDNVANTAIATFSSFSPFAVGKTGTVLPVTFSNLKAYEKQRGVQVDWNVTSDKNVSSYAVERSADGRNFSKIGTVTANQSDLASAYGFYDASPLPGTGYYRIASQQKDGSNSLSAVLRVNLNKSIKETIIYPNPVKGSMLSLLSTNLEKGNYSIRMYSVNGQELLQLRFDHNGGAINQMINLPQSLQPGLYDIMLDKAGSRVMSKKVMVQ